MPDGFLGRWSRRKLDAKDGKPLEAEPEQVAAAPAVVTAAPFIVIPSPTAVIPVPGAIETPAPDDSPPPLTLEDARALTAESDFRPFAARGVAPEVRNAAMKKLFTDPHFNVMDRLDTYIDDYGAPDPLPANLLRQMAQAQFLGLMSEPPPPTPSPALTDAHPDENADLRLQPHDATGSPSPGPGPGQAARGEHGRD